VDHWNLTTREVAPHHPEVLRSDDGVARVVVIQLPAGERLQEHETHEHTWLVVIDGELEIDHDAGGTLQAGAGTVARFDPQERREVRASENSRQLLFFAPWPGPGHPNLVA
jgi:redox-sensitive bicupin YhaK (pirin superfamily)